MVTSNHKAPTVEQHDDYGFCRICSKRHCTKPECLEAVGYHVSENYAWSRGSSFLVTRKIDGEKLGWFATYDDACAAIAKAAGL